MISAKRTRLVVTLLLLIGIVGAASWFAFFKPAPEAHSGRLGFKLAPAFDLKDSAGTAHRLSDFKGSVVLVHFWATWCPPCLEEIGAWTKFADQFQGKNVKFIAI